MENEKPYTLISTPRSGSTLTYFIVRWYLIKRYDYRNVHLGEYFNPYHYNLIYRDIFKNGEKTHKENIPVALQDKLINSECEILDNCTFKAPAHKEIFNISEQNTIKKVYDYNNLQTVGEDNETLHRILLLEADSGGNYFFKNHASPLPINAFEYMLPRYRFICVDRINKFNQYLSFAIANHTRIWMAREGSQRPIIKENSIVYTKEMFDDLTRRFDAYHNLLSIIPDNQKISIYYEAIAELTNKFNLLNMLGFNDWKEYLNPEEYKSRLPVKQSTHINPITYFKNKDEILNWYHNSKYAIITPSLD